MVGEPNHPGAGAVWFYRYCEPGIADGATGAGLMGWAVRIVGAVAASVIALVILYLMRRRART